MSKLRAFRTVAVFVSFVTSGVFAVENDPVGQGTFPGLGDHSRMIATESPRVRGLFNQGLAFLYAFNHDEAIRSFQKALEADPKCAAAAWGVALAMGPHINNSALDDDRAKGAWKAIDEARRLSTGASSVERELIEALATRYSDPPAADRGPLDRAYADAMRAVWKRHSRDADVGALFAESLMNLRPWDLWTRDGKPQPGTEEITATLETVLELNLRHPLGLHLYIHAVEASPNPERADQAADRLRDLAPGLGHLVHMSSHIDVRRGRWKKAMIANRKAIVADVEYRARSSKQGFYNVYMAHNRHMLAFAAMMRGESAVATRAIDEMLANVPEEFIREAAPIVDGLFAMPYELHLRFGRWDAMLAEKEPRETFPLARALRRYARGIALAAKKDVAAAREEQRAFLADRSRVSNEATFGNNKAADLLRIAENHLKGEILYREGKIDEALKALEAAVEFEDALRYDEPPDWILPTRHVLGAAYFDAGRFVEAESVYREDLKRLPDNGWSLLGLAKTLETRGKPADDLRRRLDDVWKDADVKATSSCLCLPAKR